MQVSGKDAVAPASWKKLIWDKKDALLCLVDQGVVSVAGFATSVLIGRNAPEELGVYFIALSIVLFVRGFQEQMISVPYTVFRLQHQDNELPAYRGSCLVQQFGFSLLALVFLAGIMVASAAGLLEASMFSPLLVLVFLLPPLLMREVIRQYCFAHQQNLATFGIDVAISVLQIGGIVVLGYVGMLSGASAWAVIGLACLVTLGVWFFQFGPTIEFQRERFAQDWNQNWGFGKWAVAGQLVGSLPTYVLPWILAEAAGTTGTGFFAAGMTLVGVANIFNTGMANFLTPKAAQVFVDEGASGLRRVILRITLLFLLVVGAFAGLLSFFGDWIAIELYGSRYIGLQLVVMILAIAKLFDSFAIVASNGLFVMEKIKANFWVDVVLMIVTLTAAILLVFPLGVIGAVWTTLISSATSAVLRFGLLLVFLNRAETAGENDAV